MSPRRRITAILFAGVGLASTGFIAAITVTALAAADLMGSERWAGLPSATSTLGTAIGSTVLAAITVRLGRRPVLIGAYFLATGAAAVAAWGVSATALPLLLVGMFLLGFGNSASHLTRYAVADLHVPEKRTAAIGWIVWASTVGSVVGPNLLEPSGYVAETLGIPELAGPYLAAAVAFGLAAILYLVALRPDPLSIALPYEGPSTSNDAILVLLSRPKVTNAVATMITGHFVMVLVMAMTPVYLRQGGAGLDIVGYVMSAHTLGMFALSPLTGLLGDRFGRERVALAGMGIILASVAIAGTTPATNTGMLLGALFLLGLGWNFGFIGGSALLSDGLSLAERLRIQGVVDAAVWMSGALASLLSGLILAAVGYSALNAIGAVMVVVPVSTYIAARRRIAAGP